MRNFRRIFLIVLVVVISLAFLWMIQTFLITILLAALFSGVAYGLHRRIVRRLGGREKAAAVVTLLVLLALVVTPLLFVAAAVANEALRINETIRPRLEMLSEPGALDRVAAAAADLRVDRAVSRAAAGACGRARQQRRRICLQRAVGDDASDGAVHLPLRRPALHDVLLSHRRTEARADDAGLSAAG